MTHKFTVTIAVSEEEGKVQVSSPAGNLDYAFGEVPNPISTIAAANIKAEAEKLGGLASRINQKLPASAPATSA